MKKTKQRWILNCGAINLDIYLKTQRHLQKIIGTKKEICSMSLDYNKFLPRDYLKLEVSLIDHTYQTSEQIRDEKVIDEVLVVFNKEVKMSENN